VGIAEKSILILMDTILSWLMELGCFL